MVLKLKITIQYINDTASTDILILPSLASSIFDSISQEYLLIVIKIINNEDDLYDQ
jgi:hypothetical protein